MRAHSRSVLFLALVAMLAVTAAAAAERVVLESIIIRVNDRIVTVNDFRFRLQQELSQIQPVPTGDDLREFTESLFMSIVDELVLLERAEGRRLTVDDETVDGALANLREQNNLQDDEAWEVALASSGLTIEQLRERYRQSILLSRTVQSEIRPTEITEEEVRRLYEKEKELYKVPAKIELEQLFFPVSDTGDSEAQVMRIAQGLVERVVGGSDLRAEATLAGVEVQDLGEIPIADLRADLRAALDGVPDNGFTKALTTAGGVQVIHVIRRIPSGYQPFEEVEENIKRRMSANAYQKQSKEFVDRLKSEFLVVIDQEQLDLILDEVARF